MEQMSGECFYLEQKLGEGMFGEVHLARHVLDGSQVAMKRIEKAKGGNIRQMFLQEIRSGSVLGHHRGIAQTKGYFESSRHYWIVMELAPGEDLISFLERRRYSPFSERDAQKIFGQIVSAVAHAHRRGVAHLDLKLENVLLDSNLSTKIIDWGLSVSEDPRHCTKHCGSPEYAAPEIWNRRTVQQTYDAFQADMFSLGVMLYALLFGRFPFNKALLSLMRSGRDVGELAFVEGISVSEEAKELCRRLLDVNPETRMRMHDLEGHSWVVPKRSPATCAS
jgi:serine/threonine protein kinase